jgi:hypothetical protein
MNLNNRVARLERTLAAQPCDCDDNAGLGWPGHQPNPHCTNCGGERVIFQLQHNPRQALPLLRAALPLLMKAFDGERLDFAKLTDDELERARVALEAAEPQNTQIP